MISAVPPTPISVKYEPSSSSDRLSPMLMLKKRRDDLADAKFGVLPRWGLSDGQTGWRTDTLACSYRHLAHGVTAGPRVVDRLREREHGLEHPGLHLLCCAFWKHRPVHGNPACQRETANIRDFAGAGASGLGALACARRRNTCLTISQAASKYSRAVANEAVKDVFEVGSERQCSIEKRGQTLLEVNIRASTRGLERADVSELKLTHRRRLSSLPEGGGEQRECSMVEGKIVLSR
jgi:hypothetical protein